MGKMEREHDKHAAGGPGKSARKGTSSRTRAATNRVSARKAR